jgi:hypothetical protein
VIRRSGDRVIGKAKKKRRKFARKKKKFVASNTEEIQISPQINTDCADSNPITAKDAMDAKEKREQVTGYSRVKSIGKRQSRFLACGSE